LFIAYGSCDEKYLHPRREFVAQFHYRKPFELIYEYEGPKPEDLFDVMECSGIIILVYFRSRCNELQEQFIIII
jgi:hypothetical protein